MNAIKSRKQLEFFIKADYMMNRGCFSPSIKMKLISFFSPGGVIQYLIALRKVNYYSNAKGLFCKIAELYYRWRHRNLGRQLGFSIGSNAFGYGLVIPHWGTIVVGDSNRIGNYCVLHTSTCISDNSKIIGDGFYVSTGAKITAPVKLGNGVTIAANSVVTKSFEQDNLLLVGMPAEKKKESYPVWYERDGEEYLNKVKKIEELKIKMGL